MLNAIFLPSPSIGNKDRETFKGTDHPIKSLDLRRAEVFYIQAEANFIQGIRKCLLKNTAGAILMLLKMQI